MQPTARVTTSALRLMPDVGRIDDGVSEIDTLFENDFELRAKPDTNFHSSDE
jgi:hypothetical protein